MFRYISLYLMLLILATPAWGQGYGKNKVQYESFNWHILKTEHFDIYYYPGAEELSKKTAELAENGYHQLSRKMNHEMSRRTPIIVYNSHNDFKQTNVTLSMIDEGTGGFTTVFRTRVVLPFTGSYAEFEHVLTHELVHVFQFDLIYGSLLDSVVGRAYLFPLPLWSIEGMAEYYSKEWDTADDMFMRDAVISDYLISLTDLEYAGGYIIYKEGQSVYEFIREEYGEEKVNELVHGLGKHRSFEKSLEATLGLSLEELNDEWELWLQRRYWPEIADRQMPHEFAKEITNHEEDSNFFINTAPSLSPEGDKIAFVRSGSWNQYSRIVLMSAINGKILDSRLVTGEQSGHFENLHTFRNKLTWSPDSKFLAFTGKAGDRDALHIVGVGEEKSQYQLKFDLDGLYSPAWSPNGDQIAFVGLKNGYSDLYLIHDVSRFLAGEIDKDALQKKITPLMTDMWDDNWPAWSPDGTTIAFSSDRPLDAVVDTIETGMGQYDIFTINPEDMQVKRVIQLSSKEEFPEWLPDGSGMMFISDESGIDNLYVLNFEDQTIRAITNAVTGITMPSWSADGKRFAFAGFRYSGWDIFLVNDPETLLEKDYRTFKNVIAEASLAKLKTTDVNEKELSPQRVLIPLKPTYIKRGSPADGDSTDSVVSEGRMRFRSKKYKLRFEPDYITAGGGYDTEYGWNAGAYVALSDVLGNHQIRIGLSSFSNSFEDSDIFVAYWYLPRRLDYSIQAFHYKNYYYGRTSSFGDYFDSDHLFSERMYGGTGMLSYPFNKFRRLEFSLTAMRMERELYEKRADGYYYETGDIERHTILAPSLGFVKDNTIWGSMGPINGSRWRIDVEQTLLSNWQYTTVTGFYHRYHLFWQRYNFAYRLLAAGSFGQDRRQFFLGGPHLLRGYKYYSVRGSRIALLNTEFRFPFLDAIVMAFPLPGFSLRGIRGAAFFDIGTAWSNEELWRGIKTDEDGNRRLRDLKASWGVGFRSWMVVLPFIIKYDIAWATDFATQSEAKHLISLGAEF